MLQLIFPLAIYTRLSITLIFKSASAKMLKTQIKIKTFPRFDHISAQNCLNSSVDMNILPTVGRGFQSAHRYVDKIRGNRELRIVS